MACSRVSLTFIFHSKCEVLLAVVPFKSIIRLCNENENLSKLFSTVKLLVLIADHLPLSSVKGTNVWICNFPLPYACLMRVGLIFIHLLLCL